MTKWMHNIENMPLQPSSIYSCHWQMSQSAFCLVKPSVLLYSDRKPRACQKLGNGPGAGKCPAPGQCKIWKYPTTGTDMASKCPAVARRGGAGRRWNWLMHKVPLKNSKKNNMQAKKPYISTGLRHTFAIASSQISTMMEPWEDTQGLHCKYPRELHTIPYNFIIRNCMEPSRRLSSLA